MCVYGGETGRGRERGRGGGRERESEREKSVCAAIVSNSWVVCLSIMAVPAYMEVASSGGRINLLKQVVLPVIRHNTNALSNRPTLQVKCIMKRTE